MTDTHRNMSRSNHIPAAPTAFPINGVKVFSATVHVQRAVLGEQVTEWIAAHPAIHLIEIVVTQSSDYEYHCLTITVFYWDGARERVALA
jgi:hypothetical protein